MAAMRLYFSLLFIISSIMTMNVYYWEYYEGSYFQALTCFYVLLLLVCLKVKVLPLGEDINLSVERNREISLLILIPFFMIAASIMNIAVFGRVWLNLGIIAFAFFCLSVIAVLGVYRYSEFFWALISNVNKISEENREDLLYVKSSTNTIEAVCINIEAQISMKDKALIEEIEKKMGKVKLYLENKIDDSKAFLNGKLNVINFQLIQIETAHGFLYRIDQVERLINASINLSDSFWTKREVEVYWNIVVTGKHPPKDYFNGWEFDARKDKYRKYSSKQVQQAAMSLAHPELPRIHDKNLSNASRQEFEKTREIMNP